MWIWSGISTCGSVSPVQVLIFEYHEEGGAGGWGEGGVITINCIGITVCNTVWMLIPTIFKSKGRMWALTGTHLE